VNELCEKRACVNFRLKIDLKKIKDIHTNRSSSFLEEFYRGWRKMMYGKDFLQWAQQQSVIATYSVTDAESHSHFT
jgi:hypothetical protein